MGVAPWEGRVEFIHGRVMLFKNGRVTLKTAWVALPEAREVLNDGNAFLVGAWCVGHMKRKK